ncbi:50S ribosomal protein L22 [bacterium]|nr:50S ribosomal protein L22 [bacterium]
MKVTAKLKKVRGSHWKLRRYAKVLKGKRAEEAVEILSLYSSPNAKKVRKVIRSAIANAENNFDLSADNLYLTEMRVDVAGPTLRRIRPRARGRAFFIRKRYSHITVGLEPKGGVE